MKYEHINWTVIINESTTQSELNGSVKNVEVSIGTYDFSPNGHHKQLVYDDFDKKFGSYTNLYHTIENEKKSFYQNILINLI